MFRHYLMCLLASMIALQSLNSVADVHQLHQSGAEHVEFDHSHQPTDVEGDNQLTKDTPEKPNQSLYDCHHCCHCHGFVALTGATARLATFFSGKQQFDYLTNLISAIPPSLFRPPIV